MGKAFVAKLAKAGARDPEALAAWIGRRKHGSSFGKLSSGGKKGSDSGKAHAAPGGRAKAPTSEGRWQAAKAATEAAEKSQGQRANGAPIGPLSPEYDREKAKAAHKAARKAWEAVKADAERDGDRGRVSVAGYAAALHSQAADHIDSLDSDSWGAASAIGQLPGKALAQARTQEHQEERDAQYVAEQAEFAKRVEASKAKAKSMSLSELTKAREKAARSPWRADSRAALEVLNAEIATRPKRRTS